MRARPASWKTTWTGLIAALCLAGCDLVEPVAAPPPPAPEPKAAPVPKPGPRSLQSEQLIRYYGRLQADLVTQGLLRTDGGGPDTPYDAETLARNFEQLVFFDEYAQGAGISAISRSGAGKLRRWSSPVRMDVSFGASIPQARRSEDLAAVRKYVSRLSRVSKHPISVTGAGNYHIMFMGDDDRDELVALLREKVPGISNATVALMVDLPRTIHCLVIAFADGTNPQTYTRAVALIRAEHPDLIRLSCIHEELAQGLGLANDSPLARPSIFNDDDEFALLTSHDEKLLEMLYDPRLNTGMDADTARPILRIIAREVMGQEL